MVYDSVRGRAVVYGGKENDGPPRADTWEHDGTHWRGRRTATTPSWRLGHGLAFSVAQARTVLFGGITGGGSGYMTSNETWEYDGVDWTRIVTANAPSPRTDCAMVGDTLRGRIVLFGGSGLPLLHSDTWEYDGIDWLLVQPPVHPTARQGHAMAFDAARGRTVLFGGTDLGAQGLRLVDDTWEYDGTNWVSVAPAARPAARGGYSMTYDPVRSRTVLFGGAGGGGYVLDDTWEYDGSNWQRMSGVGMPGFRSRHSMVYHEQLARTIVCGGEGGPTSGLTSLVHSDTWEYDGSLWRAHVTSTSPPARNAHAITYDPVRQRTVLFGGHGYHPIFNDTWEFDGEEWLRITTATTPPTMYGHAMAYDAARATTVLFGGFNGAYTLTYDGTDWRAVPGPAPPARLQHALAYDANRERIVLFGGNSILSPWYVPLDDTWEFDGSHWSNILTSVRPAARTNHGMAFHAARGRTVLFGGGTPNGYFTDTWLFDGSNWSQELPPNSPPAQTETGLAYDAVRGRTVMFGDTTWEYDGTTWTQVVTIEAPTRRVSPRLAFDQARGRTVLFGGSAWGGALSAETWELESAAVANWTRHGLGCAGSAGTPVLDSAMVPALGSNFAIQLTGLPPLSGTVLLAFGHELAWWNGNPLPRELGAFGLPGCRLWIGAAPLGSVLLPHAGNTLVLTLAIPANPALAGVVVAMQALVLDAAAPSGVGAVSNAGILRAN